MMQQEKTTEYREPLDQVLENTIEFQDDNGNTVVLQKDIIRRAYAPSDITEKEWQEFIFIVEKQRLDPTLYEVYCAKIQGKMTPLVSYRTYLKRAFSSGKLVKHPNVKLVKGNEKDKDTWVAIFSTKREGMDDDFEWEVPYLEAGYMLTRDGRKPRGGMWNVQPGFQLKVRAFVQGLRIVCADVVGGLPHVVEEIQSEDSEETINQKNQSLKETKQSGNDEQSNDASNKVENTVTDPGINGDIEEGKPNEAELEGKRKQEEAIKKANALAKMETLINSFDTIEKLNDWVDKQKSLESSRIKTEIEKMIDSRKVALASKDQVKDAVSGEIIRSSTINQIMVVTGKSFSDVNAYISDEMLTSGLISAVLSGEKGAIDEFNEGLASFLIVQNEPDSEDDIPE